MMGKKKSKIMQGAANHSAAQNIKMPLILYGLVNPDTYPKNPTTTSIISTPAIV